MSSYKIVNASRHEVNPHIQIVGQRNVFELLEQRVKKLIEEGWSCIGGMTYDSDSNIYQTMIQNTHVKLDEKTKQNQELLYKLEEQIKLNGELCKRLFQLK
jgi:hypothetical protein